MRATEIVKAIMLANDLGNAEFARQLGIEPTALWDRLNTKRMNDIPTALLDEMLIPLGYKIQIVPSDIPLSVGGYEIEYSPAETKKPNKQDATSLNQAKSKVNLDELLGK